MNNDTDQCVDRFPPTRPTSPREALLSTSVLAGAALAAMLVVWVAGHREGTVRIAPYVAEQRVPNSIAVLPFVDMSPDKDQDYFGDGLAEEILTLLAQSPQLQVISRNSSFSLKAEPVDITLIAQRLGVANVLHGSVAKSGDRAHIGMQLTSVQGDTRLWSQTYDRGLEEMPGLKREIAAAVARALGTSLPVEAVARHTRSVDVRAYDHFLRGRSLFHQRGPGDLERAREHFDAAVELEPGYARAWAGLSGVYNAQIDVGEITREVGALRRREAAERALALEPDLAEAHLRAIAVFVEDGDLARARQHFDTARILDPQNPLLLGFASRALVADGRVGESITHWDRIVANDPLSRAARLHRASHLVGVGALEAARADLLVARDLGAGEGEADALLALVKVLERRYQEALASLAPIPRTYDREVGLALAHRALGNVDESEAIVARLRADQAGEAALAMAQVLAHHGEQEEAFLWLAEARTRFERDARDPRVWAQSSHLSPFLRPLREDPRWAALYTEQWPLL
jgi:TolB-like protein/thioredoxin-like negative regulator of GroEL